MCAERVSPALACEKLMSTGLSSSSFIFQETAFMREREREFCFPGNQSVGERKKRGGNN